MLYLSDNVIFLSKVWCKCFYHWLLTDWWQPILTTVRYQWHKKNKKDKSTNISLIDTTHNITLNSTINEWQSFAGSLKIESDLMVSKNMFLLGFGFFPKRRYWVQDVSTQAWHESDECRSSRCSHDLWQVSLVRGRPSNNHKQCLQSWNWGNYTSISTNVSKYQGFRGFFSIFWNRIKWLTKKRPYWMMRMLILTNCLQWAVLSMVSMK